MSIYKSHQNASSRPSGFLQQLRMSPTGPNKFPYDIRYQLPNIAEMERTTVWNGVSWVCGHGWVGGRAFPRCNWKEYMEREGNKLAIPRDTVISHPPDFRPSTTIPPILPVRDPCPLRWTPTQVPRRPTWISEERINGMPIVIADEERLLREAKEGVRVRLGLPRQEQEGIKGTERAERVPEWVYGGWQEVEKMLDRRTRKQKPRRPQYPVSCWIQPSHSNGFLKKTHNLKATATVSATEETATSERSSSRNAPALMELRKAVQAQLSLRLLIDNSKLRKRLDYEHCQPNISTTKLGKVEDWMEKANP
ncbi:hypothetical protein BDZ91DRAFT_797114 [Kalaharituber pfeilii]|nr:hypothetical protein BDZ91DRAFT_797114 [Kalaharituber pfeilii]